MPTCDFLLVNRNGAQFSKLTEALGRLVFDAIGKYINPTRYRQIIETESSNCLDNEEQEWMSEHKNTALTWREYVIRRKGLGKWH